MTSVTAVVNLTRHAVQVISGGEVLARWEPSGLEARRAEVVRDGQALVVHGTPVPCVVIGYGLSLEGLPQPVPGTAYLVSRIVAAQTRRADVFFPWGEIRDDDGRIIGCQALGQFGIDAEAQADA